MRCFPIPVLVALAACGAPVEPEQAVREWLAQAEEAIEQEDRDTLLELISEHYNDSRGNDRKTVDQRLRVYFLRSENILLATDIEELAILGETAARVVLTAGIAGRNSGVFDWDAETQRFELELELDGDRWLLIGAHWADLGEPLH